MMVVRTLLNSWATLEASVPTLLIFCACRSCWRSRSASALGRATTTGSVVVTAFPPLSPRLRLRRVCRAAVFPHLQVSDAAPRPLHPKSWWFRLLRQGERGRRRGRGNGGPLRRDG